MKPKHSLGQVFLRDKIYIEKLISLIKPTSKVILEIGPGQGHISELVANKTKKLICVELDSKLYQNLKTKFFDNKNIEVINQDILKFDFSRFKKKIIVFGNIPYQISTSLIKVLVKNFRYIDKAYLTVQKEFGQKLTAKKASKEYSFISCYLQYHAKIVKRFDIEAKAFWPQPKVDSVFIEIDFYPDKAKEGSESKGVLFEIIRKSFNQRRKKIINIIKNQYPHLDAQSLLLEAGVDSKLRPDNLSLEQYQQIARVLLKT